MNWEGFEVQRQVHFKMCPNKAEQRSQQQVCVESRLILSSSGKLKNRQGFRFHLPDLLIYSCNGGDEAANNGHYFAAIILEFPH